METYEVHQDSNGTLSVFHGDSQTVVVQAGTREDVVQFVIRQAENMMLPKDAGMAGTLVDGVLNHLRIGARDYAKLQTDYPEAHIARPHVYLLFDSHEDALYRLLNTAFYESDNTLCRSLYEGPYVITHEPAAPRTADIIEKLWQVSPPPRPRPRRTPPPALPVRVAPEPEILRNTCEALIAAYDKYGLSIPGISVAYDGSEHTATITLSGGVADLFVKEYARVCSERQG